MCYMSKSSEIAKFSRIFNDSSFKMFNAFVDKIENPGLPGADWDYTFSEQNGRQQCVLLIYNGSLARMEKLIEMGFKGGFTTSMTNLENLLATLSKKMIGLQNIHKFYFKELE